jgi:hypothetical protein
MIRRSLKNPFVQSFGIFVAVVVLGYGGVWAYQNLRTVEYRDADTGVSVRYSSKLAVEKATSARDVQDKIVFRIKSRDVQKASGSLGKFGMTERRDSSVAPRDDMLVTMRYEDDLRKVSNTLRKDLRDILVENSEKVFAQEFIKYEKVSERTFEQNGKRAAEIIFTYLSPYGQSVTQRFMIVIRDENTAFYLSAQAPKDRYEPLNRRYFNMMFNSFDFK